MSALVTPGYLVAPDTAERVFLDANVEVRCAAVNPYTGERIVLPGYTRSHSFSPPDARPPHVNGAFPLERETVRTFLIIRSKERP